MLRNFKTGLKIDRSGTETGTTTAFVGHKVGEHASIRHTEKPSCWSADCGAPTSLRMFHLPAQAPKPVPYLSCKVTFQFQQ